MIVIVPASDQRTMSTLHVTHVEISDSARWRSSVDVRARLEAGTGPALHCGSVSALLDATHLPDESIQQASSIKRTARAAATMRAASRTVRRRQDRGALPHL